MLFPTFEFAVFFSLAFLGSWLLRPFPLRWRLFLLGMSYVFYGWWDWRFCFLLAGCTVVNWFAAERIAAARNEGARRAWLIGAAAVDLGVLAYFKYADFFLHSVYDGLDKLGFDSNPPLLEVVLPIGISFYTFQAISYVVDTYRRDTETYPALDFAVYLALFPHLVAGPIVRARELLPQLALKADPRRIDAALAFRLIFAGLFKKVVISSYMASAIVDDTFRNPDQHTNLEVLFGIYGYAIQIYADFSGYTDIAIGCALLLGLRFPQNFDAPYTARSIQDFWRRWHMTLSFWLRDYLYVPLGGNRGGESKTRRNLFLTMVLGGLWHGAAWTFIIWGAIHGGALVVERHLDQRRRALGVEPAPWSPVVRWVVTFHVVCLAWVFFRAESLGLAFDTLGRLLTGWGIGEAVTPVLALTIAAMLAAQFVPTDLVERGQVVFSRAAPAVQGVLLALGFLVVDAFGPEGVAPFIYFQF